MSQSQQPYTNYKRRESNENIEANNQHIENLEVNNINEEHTEMET